MSKTVNPDHQSSLKTTYTPTGQTLSLPLRTNFSWTLIGNVTYAASQWGILVVLSKLGTPEIVGRFALGLAITTPIFLFSSLTLRVVQVTDAKREYVFGDYLSLRLVTSFAALLMIIGIVLQAGYQRETALVILTIGIAKVFGATSDIFFGLLQQHERMDRIALSMMIRGPLALIALGIGVYLTGSLFWGTVCLTIVWALVLFSYDVPNANWLSQGLSQTAAGRVDQNSQGTISLHPRWDLRTLSKLTWLTLPLGTGLMLHSLNTNIPRYFIEWNLGARELGIFAAITYLIKTGEVVIDALARAASPLLAKYYVLGDKTAFRNLLLKLVGLGILIGGSAVIVASLAGEWLLTLLYRPEYARLDLLVLVMIVAAIRYVISFLNVVVITARYFHIQLLILLCAVGATMLASFWLIPTYNLNGAAMALLVGAVVSLIGYVMAIFHVFFSIKDKSM